jgi:hypothetical protein
VREDGVRTREVQSRSLPFLLFTLVSLPCLRSSAHSPRSTFASSLLARPGDNNIDLHVSPARASFRAYTRCGGGIRRVVGVQSQRMTEAGSGEDEVRSLPHSF